MTTTTAKPVISYPEIMLASPKSWGNINHCSKETMQNEIVSLLQTVCPSTNIDQCDVEWSLVELLHDGALYMREVPGAQNLYAHFSPEVDKIWGVVNAGYFTKLGETSAASKNEALNNLFCFNLTL